MVDNKAKAFRHLELNKVTLRDHIKIAKDAKRKLTEDKKKIEEDLDVANLVLDTTYTNAEVDALKFLQMEKGSSESTAEGISTKLPKECKGAHTFTHTFHQYVGGSYEKLKKRVIKDHLELTKEMSPWLGDDEEALAMSEARIAVEEPMSGVDE